MTVWRFLRRAVARLSSLIRKVIELLFRRVVGLTDYASGLCSIAKQTPDFCRAADFASLVTHFDRLNKLCFHVAG